MSSPVSPDAAANANTNATADPTTDAEQLVRRTCAALMSSHKKSRDVVQRIARGELLMASLCNAMVEAGLTRGDASTASTVEKYCGWLQSTYFDGISRDEHGDVARERARSANRWAEKLCIGQNFAEVAAIMMPSAADSDDEAHDEGHDSCETCPPQTPLAHVSTSAVPLVDISAEEANRTDQDEDNQEEMHGGEEEDDEMQEDEGDEEDSEEDESQEEDEGSDAHDQEDRQGQSSSECGELAPEHCHHPWTHCAAALGLEKPHEHDDLWWRQQQQRQRKRRQIERREMQLRQRAHEQRQHQPLQQQQQQQQRRQQQRLQQQWQHRQQQHRRPCSAPLERDMFGRPVFHRRSVARPQERCRSSAMYSEPLFVPRWSSPATMGVSGPSGGMFGGIW